MSDAGMGVPMWHMLSEVDHNLSSGNQLRIILGRGTIKGVLNGQES